MQPGDDVVTYPPAAFQAATIERLQSENLRLLLALSECKEAAVSRGTIGICGEVIGIVDRAASILGYQSAALVDVLARRAAQNRKWGVQNHDPITWAAILTEELGEFAQAAVEEKFGGPKAGNVREEAIDCAAVALQIIECLDRNHINPTEGKAA